MNDTQSALELIVSSWPTEKLRTIWESFFQAPLCTAHLTRAALVADVAWIESQRKRAA